MSNYELGIVPGLSHEQLVRILSAPVGIQFNLYETEESHVTA